jgi:hypothetical protein
MLFLAVLSGRPASEKAATEGDIESSVATAVQQRAAAR